MGRSGIRDFALSGVSTLVIAMALSQAPARAGSCGTTIAAGSSCDGYVNIDATTFEIYNSGAILNASGYLSAIVNGTSLSQIRTITNLGIISGLIYGIYNGGVILTIANSGSIIGDDVAIVNSYGRIGAITNSGTISGKYGIYNLNTSTIGGITNSGTISGRWHGIYNVATSIGAITNSGTISSSGNSGTFAALYNSATIGPVSNSGLISGVRYAIYNTGSIGVITNSGTISGSVYSSGNLTLVGGTGTAGTFTGGAIIAAGVSLTGGTLALNEGIDVGSGTVLNSGADLILSSVRNITGNYSQTSGTLALGASGELVVSGTAGISGGTITTSLSSTGNYLAGNGSGRTLVAAATGSSYSGVTVTSDLTGLAVSGTTSGGNLLLAYNNDYIGGSLASLTNSGTISGAAYGVYVAATGSLGTLTNTGTLSGSVAAIDNRGTIGTLTSSGAIIGNVVNSGYLGLGGTVSATGGYTQTSGTLALGSSGELVVSGAAGITGGTISASLGSTGNYLAGTTRTLVAGNDGSSYGATLTVSSPAGLSTTSTVSNGDLQILYRNDYIGGSLASLTNSGTISGEAYGVYVASTGSLGTLTNTGTLSGSVAAIDNLGSLGAVVNDGLISGNISSSGPLTLASDSGTVGTLTGGTITATGVAFTGGTLALSDAVNVGASGTVANNGANLILSGVENITGNYSQTSGTLALGASGELVVSGTAGISGGTITTTGLSSTGNYLAGNGSGRTLVAAATGSSYGGVTVTSNLAGLAVSGTTSGGNLLLAYNNDYIGGSLASLTNSGTISGEAYGVYVAATGSLGALTNTGTISGTSYAIYNTGSLSLITDSGSIGGDIYSSNDFSIAGGSGGTYGTLSGGTITVGSSGTGTLSLISGNLWLMDAVKGNVGNSGATVKLSSAVGIDGNYSQTGGGLLIATGNSGTSYGYLTVTGSATISNTAITISGSGLTKGQSFTIVDAGSASSYTDDTAKVSGTSGLVAKLSTSGDDLVATLIQNSYSSTGRSASGNAAAMGAALESLTASGTVSSGMQTILDAIDGQSSGAGQAQALKELGPSQATPAALMGFAAANLTSGAVEQHQQTAMAYAPGTGKAAGSDGHENTLWGQVMGGAATRGGTAAADGYRMKQFGLTSGVDHMFGDEVMGGMALSWVRGFTHGADGSETSSSTLDTYQVTAYGTWRADRLFVDGQAGVGLKRFHQKREIDFLNKTATADYGGEQYLLRGQTGYDIPLKGGILVTPLGGLTFQRGVTHGYTESGADAANLTVKRQGSNSLSHDLGGKVSWTSDTQWGRLTSAIRTEWVHDYLQTAITTSGSIDGAAFTTTTPRLESDGAQIGLTFTLDTSDALSVRAEYAGELRQSYQSHVGMVKLMWGF